MTERRKSRAMIAAEIVMAICLLAMLSMFPFNAKAQTRFIEINEVVCDVSKALNLIASDKRLGRPLVLTGVPAAQLNAMADHVPTKQAMVIVQADRLFILACGPDDTWAPRHYRIDVEAERKFYNAAPPPQPEGVDDLPKPKKLSRKAKP